MTTFIQSQRDPLAPYRDRRRDMCAGCEFVELPHLQKVSICCNCVVKEAQKEEIEPEQEESY